MLAFVQVIYVEDTFNSDEAEGVRLTEELTIGKQMAGGTQVSWQALLSASAAACGHVSVWHWTMSTIKGIQHHTQLRPCIES